MVGDLVLLPSLILGFLRKFFARKDVVGSEHIREPGDEVKPDEPVLS